MRHFIGHIGHRFLFLLVPIVVTVIVVALALNQCRSERIAESILSDSPCAAPCWQGIEPGAPMGIEEITKILEELPGIGRISLNSLPQGTAIRWSWKPGVWRQTGAGLNSVFVAGGKVHNIRLSVDDLTVGDVIARHGLPEATLYGPPLLPEEPYLWMHLFYPTQGLHFLANVYTRFHPVLEPTTPVEEVMYMVPAESLERWMETRPGRLVPWPGYGELQAPEQ